MSSHDYLDELRSSVAPVVHEARLREHSTTVSTHYLAVRYANATTGLEFAADWQELTPIVTLFQLIDGAFVERYDAIHVRGPRRVTFDADDLFMHRQVKASPVGRRFRRKAPGEISRIMKPYSEALLASAADVLAGDFGVFDALDDRVRQRGRSRDGS